MEWIGGGIAAVLVLMVVVGGILRRYKRCPSDRILVVYGKVGGSGKGGMSARCYHGGAAFIWPVFQDYSFLDLTPLPIDIKLEGALSQQNIRVNTPSTFTVGISTEPGVMENAAERLLGLDLKRIAELARDIIFGQMRVVMATMPIEEINADRDKLIENITNGVEGELKKIGLRLINVNVQDITDESGYIDALGKEAAARAINEAKIRVAEQERDGEIGAAIADRDRRIQVSQALATAVEGENTAKITVAASNAKRREQEAEAERLANAAEKVKAAQALEEAYRAEELSERQRGKREEATQRANVVVPALIKKEQIEALAEAEAERQRRTKKGEADGMRALMEAEAAGLMAILTQKALGFDQIVRAAGGKPELASLLLVTEQMPKLVEEQAKAIANLKIDNVTVWDSGRGGNGKTATADFVSGMVGALPPLHELTKNVGVTLPEFLGRMDGSGSKTDDDDDGGDGGDGGSGGSDGSGQGGASSAGGSSTGSTGGTGSRAGSQRNEASATPVASEVAAKEKSGEENRSGRPSRGPAEEAVVPVAESAASAASELGVANEQAEKPEPGGLIRWVKDNTGLLAALGLDGGTQSLDDPRIEEVVQTALEWAGRVSDPNSSWYYVKDGQWVGPRNWYRVSQEALNRPDLPVNLGREKSWLPYGVIDRAMRNLN